MPEMTPIDTLPHPAMVIDTVRSEIRSANAQARQLWGLRDTIDLPIALDAAMPALKHLAKATGNSDPQSAALVFWTWAGAQHLKCSFQPSSAAGDVLVVFDDSAPDGTARSARDAMAQVEPDGVASAQSVQPSNASIDVHAMAHELRTPIGAIIALAEMIETEQFGTIGDPRYREYARDIGDSARLSLGIVASTLEQNAKDTDLLKGFAELNLAELIQKCLRTVHQSAREAKVTLRQVVPGDLPHLIASGPGLTQILLNLLSNAVKFTPEGGIVTVEAATTAQGEITMSVCDTGVGMTAIDANVLIANPELGKAADGTKETEGHRQPRHGIGFSLVRRLADAMSAKCEITSTRGIGTHVTLTFPSAMAIPMTIAENEATNGD